MKDDYEIDEKTHVTISLALLWSVIAGIVTIVLIGAAGYWKIEYQLDRFGENYVPRYALQEWSDKLRDDNQRLPLLVPSIPRNDSPVGDKDQPQADMMASDQRVEVERNKP